MEKKREKKKEKKQPSISPQQSPLQRQSQPRPGFKKIPVWVWPIAAMVLFFIILLVGITRKPAPPPAPTVGIPPQEKVVLKEVTFKREANVELTSNRVSVSFYGIFDDTLSDYRRMELLLNKIEDRYVRERWPIESLKIELQRYELRQMKDYLRWAEKKLAEREAAVRAQRAALKRKTEIASQEAQKRERDEQERRYPVIIYNRRRKGNVTFQGIPGNPTLRPGEKQIVYLPAGLHRTVLEMKGQRATVDFQVKDKPEFNFLGEKVHGWVESY